MNANEWIKHDGGECPIPWAGPGEWEALRLDGTPRISDPMAAKDSICWSHKQHSQGNISAYRLTDGWIPVRDGQCPFDAGPGQWQWWDRKGRKNTARCATEEYTGLFDFTEDCQIIAVRLIKQHSIDINECLASPPISSADQSSSDQAWFEAQMRIYEAKRRIIRDAKQRKAVVPPIGQNEMLLIAALAMRD